MKKKAWEKPVCEKVKLRQAEAKKGGCGAGIGNCKNSDTSGGPHQAVLCHVVSTCKVTSTSFS
jgi:hypothetical protein